MRRRPNILKSQIQSWSSTLKRIAVNATIIAEERDFGLHYENNVKLK